MMDGISAFATGNKAAGSDGAGEDRSKLYRPPAPYPTTPHRALLQSLMRRERDLLALLPQEAYEIMVGEVGFSRRHIILVNDPEIVRKVLTEDVEFYPKNDLMVASLEPLVGEGMFISSGARWQRQRSMVESAFTHMRINRAFDQMRGAVDAYEDILDQHARSGAPLSLEAGMSQLTADIIYRTIFSRALGGDSALEIFQSFARFQDAVSTVNVLRLLYGKPFAKIKQSASVLEDCRLIRGHLGALVDERLKPGASPLDDIAGDVIAARDPKTGVAFDREEVIDQIGVFFMAGHETTASALTWAFFILSQLPDLADQMVAEVDAISGDGEVEFEDTKKLLLTRAVMRETLRLYPPLGFVPRVALQDMWLGEQYAPRGAMVMISPWLMHRHVKLWDHPDRFDPSRFLSGGEGAQLPGAYMPFGQGPRICIGAAFALMESVLILARLTRRYRFETQAPETVRPVSKLSTRPANDMVVTVHRR